MSWQDKELANLKIDQLRVSSQRREVKQNKQNLRDSETCRTLPYA